MSTIEKISIAMPTDMLRMVRDAVGTGDYASTSEVVREALREWKARRAVTLPAPAAATLFPLSDELTRRLAAVCINHGVQRLGLFGSVLRRDFDASTSDVDAVVEFETVTAQSARQYFDLKAALEVLFGRTVDLVELGAMPDSPLKRIIERSQVTVYERPQAA